MAELTKEEAEQLEALQAKKEAPDEPKGESNGLSRVLNVSVDLGDPEQVQRAIGLGLLTEPEIAAADGDGDGDGDNPPPDEEPHRRGYFGKDA